MRVQVRPLPNRKIGARCRLPYDLESPVQHHRRDTWRVLGEWTLAQSSRPGKRSSNLMLNVILTYRRSLLKRTARRPKAAIGGRWHVRWPNLPGFHSSMSQWIATARHCLGSVNGSRLPECTSPSNDLVLWHVALALAKHPRVRVYWNGTTPKLAAEINIAVAMATPYGLVAPVIRSANVRSLEELAAEVRRLKSLAFEQRLAAEDVSGASFSVSNLGGVGVDDFTALVSAGQGSDSRRFEF